MKKLVVTLGLLLFVTGAAGAANADVIADTVKDQLQIDDLTIEGASITPDQKTVNEKGFLGVNYNRQDSTQTGKQTIVNDHSFFNINIQIIKKGALFKNNETEVGALEE